MNNFILTNILIIFFINYILCGIPPKSRNSVNNIESTKWKCIFDSMCNGKKLLSLGFFTCTDHCDSISSLDFIKPPLEICSSTVFNRKYLSEICTKENIKTELSNCIMNITETFENKMKPGCNSESSMKNIQPDKLNCWVACFDDFFKTMPCGKSSGLNDLYMKIINFRKRDLPVISKLSLDNILGKGKNIIPKLGKC